jgi:transcriptional regulator with XRE-family HTH domain
VTITPAQIRAARAMLRLTQEELAAKAGLSQRSLAMIETEGAKPREGTLERLRAALEEVGAVFIESDVGVGVLQRRDVA